MHPLVQRVVDYYLHAADAAVPNLVEGLYLEGSVALGDFQPDSSDIDFVAVTAEPLSPAALAQLERVHGRVRERFPRPCFDGIYLTWQDLARAPSEVTVSARCLDGKFRAAPIEPPSPVSWHTVARYGIACRGPQPKDLDIVSDDETLAAWTDGNLASYWTPLVASASHLGSRWGLISLTAYGTVWIVGGVSRLHYTLATGDIASKASACRHALAAFPEWQRIITEALRLRQNDRARPALAGSLAGFADHLPLLRSRSKRSLYATPFARRLDVLAFAGAAIADAHKIYERRRLSVADASR